MTWYPGADVSARAGRCADANIADVLTVQNVYLTLSLIATFATAHVFLEFPLARKFFRHEPCRHRLCAARPAESLPNSIRVDDARSARVDAPSRLELVARHPSSSAECLSSYPRRCRSDGRASGPAVAGRAGDYTINPGISCMSFGVRFYIRFYIRRLAPAMRH